MAKNYFMPRKDLDRDLWLQNFASKLPQYATKYNIKADDVTDIQNSSAYFTYRLNFRNQFEEFAKKLTHEKNELIHGVPAGAEASVVPQPPVLPSPPASVAPGIFVRAASIANIIKSNKDYTIADGNDLAIEGAEDVKDIHSMKPVLTLRLIEGGKPEVQWKKSGMDSIEIHVDRGDGNFVFLANDTYPHYTDSTPITPGTASAVWKYKAIYRYNDQLAGQWSDVVNITVTGK